MLDFVPNHVAPDHPWIDVHPDYFVHGSEDELERIAGQCDGVRCDMAMLVLPEVFEWTWGIRSGPFWPKASARTFTKSTGADQ